jgi:DNA replication and repair protein RecF
VRLTTLEVARLRNLETNHIDLSPGLTVVVGKNGQGKTSLLEAVYLLGTGRSFRTRRLDDLIAWSGGPLQVRARLIHRLGERGVAVVAEPGSRHLLVDDNERELEDYLGHLDVVDLAWDRMQVLRGGPEERRRFLDRGVVSERASYLRDLGRYRRVLAQRNALLRQGAGHDAELDAWDERLVDASGPLHAGRRAFVTRLGERVAAIACELLPEGRKLGLRYRPSPEGALEQESSDFSHFLAESLRRSRPRDRGLGHTGHGPHRDELAVELDEIDLRRFGSAGQVRASMIALKLGRLSLLHEVRGDAPLFLMDDFDSDLDEVRAAAVAGFLHRGGFQALVATSKETLPGRLGVAFSTLRMEDGIATPA